MNVYPSLAEAGSALRSASIALGNFDGVHAGHQALFAAAIEHAHARGAKAAALTFDPHPAQILAPAVAPPRLSSLATKLALMEQLGLDAVVVHPFTAEFAKLEPSAFADALFDQAGVREVVVGFDFTYGRNRAGTIETLTQAGRAHGAEVTVVSKVTVDGLPASSTKVRELLLEGKVEATAALLKRHYALSGAVVHGLARGRTLGFPTANLQLGEELVPAAGVYATLVEAHERWWAAAANIGRKPTFGGDEALTVEFHLLDFQGDLYGQPLRALFIDRLRGEQRFAGIDALREQIGRDAQRARELAWASKPLVLDPAYALDSTAAAPKPHN